MSVDALASYPRRRLAARLARVTAGVAALLSAGSATAGDLVVRYDQSQLLRMPRPVADVIVGNPSIADVTVQGGNLLVVTGKTFGVTNIIALDQDHNVIQDQRITVERDGSRLVFLMKGGVRQSYTCNPSCSPTLTIGDDQQFFDTVAKHNQQKMKSSEGGGGEAGGIQAGP
jgi:Pilus formation protein N terminal region